MNFILMKNYQIEFYSLQIFYLISMNWHKILIIILIFTKIDDKLYNIKFKKYLMIN